MTQDLLIICWNESLKLKKSRLYLEISCITRFINIDWVLGEKPNGVLGDFLDFGSSISCCLYENLYRVSTYLKNSKNAINIIIKSLQIDMLVNIVSVIINKIYYFFVTSTYKIYIIIVRF